jgi:hypothetical protein
MGRWGEAYGDFVRAASVPRFAADEGEEGMGHMVEECMRVTGSGMVERVETAGRDGGMAEEDNKKAVVDVKTPKPNGGLMRQGTFGSGSGRDTRVEEAGTDLAGARTEEEGLSETVLKCPNSFHFIVEEEDGVQDEGQTGGIPDVTTPNSSTHQQHGQKPEEDNINDRQLDDNSKCPYTSHPFIFTHSETAVERPQTEGATSVSTT